MGTLNDRYEHLLMQISIEMNGLKRDNYILKLKLEELVNVHKAQMIYLKLDNDELNVKLKRINNFHLTVLNSLNFVRKKIDLMRRINNIYERRLNIFNKLITSVF